MCSTTGRLTGSVLVLTFLATHVHAGESPPDPISTAIQRLADASASVREGASRLLWQSGRAAEKQLEQAASGPDPEVAARCAEILVAIREGLPLGLPATVVELVRGYRKGDAASRVKLIEELANSTAPLSIILVDLIAAEDNPVARAQLASLLADNLGHRVTSLLHEGDWPRAEAALEWGVTAGRRFANEPPGGSTLPAYVSFLLARGRLGAAIELWQRDPHGLSAADAAPILAALHRARGDHAAAARAMSRTADRTPPVRIAIDAADYATAAAELTRISHPPIAAKARPQDLASLAALHHLAGDHDAADAAANELVQAAAPRNTSDLTLTQRATILSITVGPSAGAQLLLDAAEHAAACEILALSGDLKRALSIAGTPAGRYALDLAKGRILMELGDREQAVTFLRNAAPPLDGDNDAAAADYAAVMSSLGLRDIAVEQYKSSLVSRDPGSPRRLLPALFGGDDSAFFWWQYLRHTRGPNDPPRTFAQLNNLLSHRIPPDEFTRLAHEVLKWIGHTARPPAESATYFVHLGDAAAGHGRTDLARELFIKVTRLPLDPPTPRRSGTRNFAQTLPPALPAHPPAQCVAWLRLGDLAAAARDWPEAERCYKTALETDRANGVAARLWSDALGHLNRREEGRWAKELSRLIPLGLESRRPWCIAEYRRRGLTAEAAEQERWLLRSEPHTSAELIAALERHAAELESQRNAAAAAAACERLLILRVMDSMSFETPGDALRLAQRIHRLRAIAHLKQGELAAGIDRIDRCQRLMPLDVQVLADTLPVLDLLDAPTQIRRLLEAARRSLDAARRDHPRAAGLQAASDRLDELARKLHDTAKLPR